MKPTAAIPPTPANNTALASLFHQMANCYRYMGNKERFRAIAYENIARRLLNMKEDIAAYATDEKTLDAIGGIGESIAGKIIEYLRTGSISTLDELKATLPFELLELQDHAGIGPATLRLLYEQLYVISKEQLAAAVEDGRLAKIKGLALKKIDIIKQALKLDKAGRRMPLAEAEKLGTGILLAVKKIPGVQAASLAGSLRRKKDTVGDIDIVIVAEPLYRKKIVERFCKLPAVEKVLAKGLTKASVILKKNAVQVDIRLVHDYEYGAAMLYFTGSREHNIKLRTIAKARGYKINEYGIFNTRSGKRLAGATEEELYAFLQLKFIPPEQRLDKGEIEKAFIN